LHRPAKHDLACCRHAHGVIVVPVTRTPEQQHGKAMIASECCSAICHVHHSMDQVHCVFCKQCLWHMACQAGLTGCWQPREECSHVVGLSVFGIKLRLYLGNLGAAQRVSPNRALCENLCDQAPKGGPNTHKYTLRNYAQRALAGAPCQPGRVHSPVVVEDHVWPAAGVKESATTRHAALKHLQAPGTHHDRLSGLQWQHAGCS